jgi:hypothetical protein
VMLVIYRWSGVGSLLRVHMYVFYVLFVGAKMFSWSYIYLNLFLKQGEVCKFEVLVAC